MQGDSLEKGKEKEREKKGNEKENMEKKSKDSEREKGACVKQLPPKKSCHIEIFW